MVAWTVEVAVEKKKLCTDLGIFWRFALEFEKLKEEIPLSRTTE